MSNDGHMEPVDPSDPLRPTGPYGIAKACEDTIARLERERESLPRSEKKAVNRRIHQLRQMARWCKTRAGYVEPRSADWRERIER